MNLVLLGSVSLSAGGCTLLLGEIPSDEQATDASHVDGDAAHGFEDAGAADAWPPPPLEAGPPSMDAEPAQVHDAAGPEGGAVSDDAGDFDSGLFDGGLDAGDGGDELPDPDAGEPTDRDAAGPVEEDAGDAPEEDAATPCVPKVWYEDMDGDTYGNSSKNQSACVKPGPNWVERGGDCADQNVFVHPKQTAYFGEAYTRPDGKLSFDYDCSGQEEAKSGQALAPALCDLACSESGYDKTDRTGTGVDSYCGSKSLSVCTLGLTIPPCRAVATPTDDPYLCR